ncbi:aldo/keto reductase [Pelomonas sp. KK5]|uniref:aldo/keto reductase n=1 Tax=Pelomonas sp. KK5 TaxID=1855730 RepID=UPI00097C110E|nr:aldo/keto reductase [Pelomonas sp. KK5]
MNAFQPRPFGHSGLLVSSLAYGAMSITADPGIAAGVAPSLLRALERGVNLIDTARIYPGSEALVRSSLAAWRGPRPLISTKLQTRCLDAWRFPHPLHEAYTPASIRQSVDESLAALGVETLDIVHLHQWHYGWTHEPDWLETLQALRREGKLRCIAVSAQDHEHDALLELVSRRMVDGIQLIVNLFESRPLNAVLPLAEARGVGVIGRCVMDSGGLAGGLGREDFAARRFLQHAPYDEYRRRLDRMEAALCPQHAGSLAELALRFAAFAPGVSSITLGTSTAAWVDQALAVLDKGPLAQEAVRLIAREHVWSKNFYEELL